IAIASVPNQKLYDSIYQERYMGLPDDNAEGYRLGSPITYASQLKGNLLLIHGTGDDNVHYQGVELLMDQLIANHRHFTVMPYPSRSHGIHEGANTYRHLFTLMTRYLVENLKEVKPGPQFEQEVAAVPKKPREQPGISSRTILGWTVKIDDRLLNDEPKATLKALKLLEAQLEEIVRVVPAPAVEKLREVTLWFSPEYPGTGQRAEYHPGAGWLKENGRNPEMVKGVEFTNVKIFEAETRRMPNFALHELAHAYHDRILSYEHAGIRAAYERAKASGTYDKVERQDSEGKRHIDKAYAMSNPMEYFAELTEAYFSRNDFFPFDNTELKAHDPQMFELLGKLWGVEK
ncbi:MAG: prolyl oligopeptidase family serine peptidase, partial [Planctomycetota bacterium]|nr:prolyl oligopeptidase family serine peptidase [Planctomycetota bacterium]